MTTQPEPRPADDRPRPVTPLGPPPARGGLTIIQAVDAEIDELLSA